MSLGGALLWIYLLIASFSVEVRALLPWHPLTDALTYYLISCALAEYKARMVRC